MANVLPETPHLLIEQNGCEPPALANIMGRTITSRARLLSLFGHAGPRRRQKQCHFNAYTATMPDSVPSASR